MPATTLDVRFPNLLAELGAPLFAIAAVTSHFGIGVGATSTIWAAVLSAALAKTLYHFVLGRQLTLLGWGAGDARRYVATALVNGLIGVGCALLTLPS